MNLDTMDPDGYRSLFPEHAKAKVVYEKSQIISNFTDWLASQGVVPCQKHVHIDACYGPSTGVTENIGGVWCGVSGRPKVCGLSEGFYYLIGELWTGLTARYFGINLAACDREETELRQLRAGDHSLPLEGGDGKQS
jgi:hypothetical protein